MTLEQETLSTSTMGLMGTNWTEGELVNLTGVVMFHHSMSSSMSSSYSPNTSSVSLRLSDSLLSSYLIGLIVFE